MDNTKTRYFLPDMDRELAQKKEAFDKEIPSTAETHAILGLIKPNEPNIKPFFDVFDKTIRGFLLDVPHRLQLATRIHELDQHKKSFDKKLQDLRLQIPVVKDKGKAIAAKLLNKSEPYNPKTVLRTKLAILLLSVFDGLFTIQVFSMVGSGWIESVMQGLLFGALNAAVAHKLKWVASFAKTPKQRWAIIIATFMVMTCLYTLMAQYRVAHLEQQEGASHISPLFFIIISLLIFTVSVAYSFKNMPTEAQKNEMKEYQKLVKERQENDAEQARLKTLEATIINDDIEFRHMHNSIIEYGRTTQNTIIGWAHQGLALYKHHYMLNRKDGVLPTCFNSDIYPFTEFKNDFADL